MSAICRLFRIEHHLTSLGPISNGESPDFLNKISSKSQISFEKDKQLTKNIPIHFVNKHIEFGKALFAFKTITQIKQWYSNAQLELLHQKGYVLSVYNVDRDNLCSFSKQIIILNKDNKEKLWFQSLQHLIY